MTDQLSPEELLSAGLGALTRIHDIAAEPLEQPKAGAREGRPAARQPAPRWPTVCGTGHRKLTKDQWTFVDGELERLLLKLRDEHGTVTIISGMARGYDLRLAELALLYGFRLHAFVPFPGQIDYGPWTGREQDMWQDLMNAAHQVTMVTRDDPDLANHRAVAACMHRRNRAMLRNSQAALACWDPANHRSGTFKTIGFAIEMGRPIVWMNLRTGKTTMPTPPAWARILSSPPE